MREAFLKDELPTYMGFLTKALRASGGPYIAGEHLTIADCQLLPQLTYFTKGVADFVPASCLDAWPEVVAYIARLRAVPAIKGWYGL